MVKLLAFHLPQYHRFPENDAWWGEGFTDWSNIRRAKPLFPGHRQPVTPLCGYYDMTDPATHQMQADLAQKYGIYGFCYYHYWFGGKLLMERPVEMLLDEPEISLPFCLCWANEPWTRAWDGKRNEILMPQSYGNIREWNDHIEYLLPFFRDPRYIRVEGRPLFVIYRTNQIPNCDEMIGFWDRKCREAGLDGIYVCEERNGFQTEAVCQNSRAVLDFEPVYTRILQKGAGEKARNRVMEWMGKPYATYSWDKTAAAIAARRPEAADGKRVYPGVFTGWDNTPRRARGGIVAMGAGPGPFEKLLRIQMKKCQDAGIEFLFINAWNEWAEGAYLEPDTGNQYRYLEVVRRCVDEICLSKDPMD